jgi:hypothetical protein
MNSSFSLINDLSAFLTSFDARWFVSGGWAIDIHLNRVIRERCDLDMSVPFSDRLRCIEFFLQKGWKIEGKLSGGFKTLRELSDYTDDIHYFWSFPEGADFVSEYMDEKGNRRIDYNRDTQHELDYIEVFFDRIEDRHLVFRRDPQVKRPEDLAILARDGIRYLAPELVLLYKSNNLSEKNLLDFHAAIDALEEEALTWLLEALSFMYGNAHKWAVHLESKTAQGPRTPHH